MNRRHALGLLSAISAPAYTSCSKNASGLIWRGVFFGIPVSIRFRGIPYAETQALGQEALAFIQPYERIFSLWEENSELSILNREGILQNSSIALLDLLGKAGELHRKTDGLFDPTIHSYLTWLKSEHAKGGRPDFKETKRRREFVDFNRVEISEQEIRLPKGFSLDLNSIAQGYLTDLAVGFLAPKCDSALVNFGEYRVIGEQSFPVEVSSMTLQLSRALAVSSGSGERLSATSSENHLLNPKTGESPDPKKIFIVEADEAWLADGLATIMAIGGEIPDVDQIIATHSL